MSKLILVPEARATSASFKQVLPVCGDMAANSPEMWRISTPSRQKMRSRSKSSGRMPRPTSPARSL